MAESISQPDTWGTRTPHDLGGLFVELARLLKAIGFYQPGHPVREELRDRAYQAWTIELERSGPIELERKQHELYCQTPSCQIESRLVRDFVQLLEIHSIEHLLFIPKLDLATFSRFSELLIGPERQDPRDVSTFSERLYADSSGGIEVNRVAREIPEDDATSGQSTASLGSALLNPTQSALNEPTAASLAAPRSPEPDADYQAPPAPSQPIRPRPVADPLGHALEKLESCTNDTSYQSILDSILQQLHSPQQNHNVAEAYRLALLLADHAAGQAGSSGAQARMAQTALESLCDLALLDYMMDRSCSAGTGEVRAAQVLLRLGELAVPAILERLQREQNLEDRAQLSAIVIALGEHAVPELVRVIANPKSRSTQLAVRLAGEIQNPKVVPVLVGVLKQRDKRIREEAARALVHIGNSEACEALVVALGSGDDELRVIAATHLGVLRDERTCPALIRAFDRAWRERKMPICEAMIQSLGQLTSQREEVVRRLGEILHRRRLVWRKKERACKLAALGVLDAIHSVPARRAVVYATSDPDTSIAERARELLGGALES